MVSYGIGKFCHYPQTIPDLNNNIDIPIPKLSDWKCERWDNLDATITQGDTTYHLSNCQNSSACKKCRTAMEEGMAWAVMGMLGLVPVGVFIILSKCCGKCIDDKYEKPLVGIAILCLIGSILTFVTGLRYAAAECHEYNQELNYNQAVIWNATTNGADHTSSSIQQGVSAYLAIGAVGCGVIALVLYFMFFFFMSGASWLLFLVLLQGALSTGFAIASLSFSAWYSTGIELHKNTAQYSGYDVDYTFYTLVTYGVSQFCYYPREIPGLDTFSFIGIPSLDDLECKSWDNLDAQMRIDGTDYTLLSCTDTTGNATATTESACQACAAAMTDAEYLGSLAVVLTLPVVVCCMVLVLGDAVCPSCCFGRRAYQFLSGSGIVGIAVATIFYLSAIAVANNKCDDLNSELESTTKLLWDKATNGKETSGSTMSLGPSAICAVISLIFSAFAFCTFLYYATCKIPRAQESPGRFNSGDEKRPVKVVGSPSSPDYNRDTAF
mmetsp:Transcript_31261/g.60346  ORF Transcript_31261/g.60346 Transcript_31261/m.60346 type:complete len:495 (-) Transcript_31261:344-1828(-)